MAYTDFTLESVEKAFGLTTVPGVLFTMTTPVTVPAWLTDV